MSLFFNAIFAMLYRCLDRVNFSRIILVMTGGYLVQAYSLTEMKGYTAQMQDRLWGSNW